MANNADTVVFVGVPDLVRITGVSKSYLSRIAKTAGTPGAKLPAGHALINGKPVWILDTLIPSLEAAGYRVDAEVAAQLREERSVPRGFVPVGSTEGAESIGISKIAMQARQYENNLPEPAFRLGEIAFVWDLNVLVAYARANGDPVDEEAIARWRAQNSGGLAPAAQKIVAHVRLEAVTVDGSVDAAMQELTRRIREVDRVTVLDAVVESVEVTDVA